MSVPRTASAARRAGTRRRACARAPCAPEGQRRHAILRYECRLLITASNGPNVPRAREPLAHGREPQRAVLRLLRCPRRARERRFPCVPDFIFFNILNLFVLRQCGERRVVWRKCRVFGLAASIWMNVDITRDLHRIALSCSKMAQFTSAAGRGRLRFLNLLLAVDWPRK